VPVISNQSVTLHYQGNFDRASLFVGGNVIDRVDIGDETSGQLNFLSGGPIHRGLAGYNRCEVEFQSTDPTPPMLMEVIAANDLKWDDIPNGMFFENVTLTQPGNARKNNVILYQRTGDSGICCLRYCA
jgi:hypothetical protein